MPVVDFPSMNDEPLRSLSARQHRLVAVRQARKLGLTNAALRHGIASGMWERMSSRVIGLVGAPSTALEPAMLAVLHYGPSSYVARESALALWGLPGFDLGPVHVVVRRRVNRRDTIDGVVEHSTRDLLESQITDTQGLPITTPIRAIFDIAATAHPKKVERALDNAWARGLVTYALLHRTLDELGDRGRTGLTLMRELAEARPADYRPPGSSTESRVNEILERAGERTLRRQVDRGTQSAWVGRVDLVDDELPFSVEVQSELFHGSVLDRRNDQLRIAGLRSSGHEVVEIWDTEVWRNPRKVLSDIRNGRARARARVLGTESAA
jgi:hypothetical protein